MKLATRDIAGFVMRPSDAPVIVIYGPDAGLIQERAGAMIPKLIPNSDDPMAICILNGDEMAHDPALFMDEANAISLLGPTKRVIRIHDGDDACTPVLKAYVSNPNPDIRVVVIAGNLGPKSSLRAWAEKEPSAVALPCYVEGEQEVQSFITTFLRDNNVVCDRDVVAYLANQLLGDRLVLRRQLEKLAIYKGLTPTPLTMEDVQEAIPDLAQKTLDDLVYAAFDAHWPELYRTLDSMMAEHISFMLILRTIQNHARRLEVVHEGMAAGKNQAEAMKSLYPAVFFKVENRFRAQLSAWTPARLEQLQSQLLDLESDLKTYGGDMTTPLLGHWFLTHMGSGAKVAA